MAKSANQEPAVKKKGHTDDFEADWEEASKLYRLWLYHEGQEVKPDLDKGARGRKGMSQEDLEVVERLDGKLPLAKV